eukprot:1153471-Pelagomonas_calceolata.AAC.5
MACLLRQRLLKIDGPIGGLRGTLKHSGIGLVATALCIQLLAPIAGTQEEHKKAGLLKAPSTDVSSTHFVFGGRCMHVACFSWRTGINHFMPKASDNNPPNMASQTLDVPGALLLFNVASLWSH